MLDVSQLGGGVSASLDTAKRAIETIRRYSHMKDWEGYLSILRIEHKNGYARVTYPIYWSSNRPSASYQKRRKIIEVYPMGEL